MTSATAPLGRGRTREALEEELRRVRLGPLYRPNATLRQLYETYLEQYDVAPSTVASLKDNMRPALASFGEERVGELRVDRIAAWRAKLPEGKRYRSLRSLRQILAAGVRWKWIEDNPAALVKNPEPKPGEIDAIGEELDEIGAALVVFLCGTGVRPEEAFGGEWRDVDLERRMFRMRRAYAKGRLKDFAKRAVPLRTRVVTALEALPVKRRGSCSRRPRAGGSISTTGATVSGRRASRPPASSTGGSTTCGTRARRGVWRRAWTSSRSRGGWARA